MFVACKRLVCVQTHDAAVIGSSVLRAGYLVTWGC